MKPTIEINQTNFESEVLQSVKPVLVDFWAEWGNMRRLRQKNPCSPVSIRG